MFRVVWMLMLLHGVQSATSGSSCQGDSLSGKDCLPNDAIEVDENILLQAKSSVLQTSDSYEKEGRKEAFWPSPTPASEAPAVYYDGGTKVPLEVKRLPNEFATDMFFSYAGQHNNITVNATHVIFPMYASVQGNYILRMNGLEDAEVGVTKHRYFNQNPMMQPVFSPNITVGVAEKAHALWRKKPLDTTAYDRANAYEHSNWKWNNREARNYRTTLVAIGARPGPQIMSAAGVPHDAVNAWANDGADAPSTMTQTAATLKSLMDAELGKLKVSGADLSDALMSSTNCLHWDGVAYDEERQIITFPLNKKLGIYRGRTVGTPFVAYEMLQGTSFWSYDEANDKVEFFGGMAIHARYSDPWAPDPEKGLIQLGATNGIGQPVTYAGDSYSSPLASFAYALKHERDLWYNQDLGFLFEDPSVICPESHQQVVNDYLEQVIDKQEEMAAMPESDRTLTLSHKMTLASTIDAMVACGTTFLKPDHMNAAEYNIFMAEALAHAICEIPAHVIMSILGARDWNDINIALV